MDKFFKSLLFFLCLLPSAGYTQFDFDKVNIDLITISPGDLYWEAFGHSAIRIQSGDFDKMFGFGYFDFEEEDFFVKFAKGEMRYFLGVVESSDELFGYRQQGRKTISQRLDLTVLQKKELVNKLVILSQDENKYYQYDYFLNNCTSQIRDILDEVTNGEISNSLVTDVAKNSWNDLTFPASNQAWMNLGIAYVYGLPAYDYRSQWQLSVFPEVFSEDIKNLKSSSHWNKNYIELYHPKIKDVKLTDYSFIRTHYAVIAGVMVLLVGLFFFSKTTTVFWLIFQSLLGIGLLMLWFLTKHTIAMWNINVLIFFPFAFLLLFEKFKKPMFSTGFLIINLLWILVAGLLTNYYLIGFTVINLIIWKKISKI